MAVLNTHERQAPAPAAQRRESVAAIQGIQSKLAMWERRTVGGAAQQGAS